MTSPHGTQSHKHQRELSILRIIEECISFTIEAMIRSYHVYKDIWNVMLDEELQSQMESGYITDPFAVAVIRDRNIVVHVPRNISFVCSLFLQSNYGSLVCHITGSMRFVKICCRRHSNPIYHDLCKRGQKFSRSQVVG